MSAKSGDRTFLFLWGCVSAAAGGLLLLRGVLVPRMIYVHVFRGLTVECSHAQNMFLALALVAAGGYSLACALRR